MVISEDFKYKDKLYRVKAINKDIVDKCCNKGIKVQIVQNEGEFELSLRTFNIIYYLLDVLKQKFNL